MRFGASVWPFQWSPPYGEALRRIAKSGFRAAELIAWNGATLADYYTPEEVRNLRIILDGEGLAHSQFVATPPGLASADAAQRDAGVEQWKRAVATGAALGAPVVNMVAPHGFGLRDGTEYPRITRKPLVQRYAATVPSGLDWSRNYDDWIDTMRRCAEAAAAAGVTMSVEPHPARYVGNTDGALRMLERVDHPALGINFDPSHTFPVGDFPNVSIYRLGRRIVHCHASDNDAVTNVHWRPGRGKIDWRQMLTAFREVGYDGVISIELEDVPGRSPGRVMQPDGTFVNLPAEQVFVDESVAGMEYLKAIAREVGLAVEA